MSETGAFVPTRILGSESWKSSIERADGPIRGEVELVRSVDIAIVGGGPSGLVASYRLRHEDILLLEAETEIGGNARSAFWDGIPWPMGAIVTYKRSPAMALYDELGLEPKPTDSSYGRQTFLGDRYVEKPLWEGGLENLVAPKVAASIRDAGDELLNLDLDDAQGDLDRHTLARLFKPYRPEVQAFFDQLLGWFGGTTNTYSALVGACLARSQMGEGLGVLYPEGTSQGGPYTFPGGLGHATRALARKINEAGGDRIWTECPVVNIESSEDQITIHAYRAGRYVEVRAGAAIVAVPKVVAREIVTGLPEDQRRAMQQFRSAPFLVIGIAADSKIAAEAPVARMLDGPFATFRHIASSDQGHFYRCEVPLSVEVESHRLDDSSLRGRVQRIVEYLEWLFPGAGNRISEVHAWRRGRNWYVPVPGMVTEFQPKAASPLGRLTFANADSLGPISEFGWAMIAADRAVDRTRRVLAAKGQP